MAIQHLSHIGLCVADLTESLRFYTQGLGFHERHRLEVAGEHAERLLEIPGLELEAVYLERDGVCVELLHYRAPGHTGDNTPRPMNARGLTHLSLVTDDLTGDLDRLEALRTGSSGHTDRQPRLQFVGGLRPRSRRHTDRIGRAARRSPSTPGRLSLPPSTNHWGTRPANPLTPSPSPKRKNHARALP